MRNYLIDESIFVYLDRKDYRYHNQLVTFLEDARISRSGRERNHELFLPHLSKLRLGAYRLYGAFTFMKKLSKGFVLEPLEKAEMRAQIANSYISKYLKLPYLSRIFKWLFPKKLIDLYIYSNENKSKNLLNIEKRRMLANEIISLDTCEIAMIARAYKYDVLSFNTDFSFLTMLPGKKSSYITYIHPDDLLDEYVGGRDS